MHNKKITNQISNSFVYFYFSPSFALFIYFMCCYLLSSFVSRFGMWNANYEKWQLNETFLSSFLLPLPLSSSSSSSHRIFYLNKMNKKRKGTPTTTTVRFHFLFFFWFYFSFGIDEGDGQRGEREENETVSLFYSHFDLRVDLDWFKL